MRLSSITYLSVCGLVEKAQSFYDPIGADPSRPVQAVAMISKTSPRFCVPILQVYE